LQACRIARAQTPALLQRDPKPLWPKALDGAYEPGGPLGFKNSDSLHVAARPRAVRKFNRIARVIRVRDVIAASGLLRNGSRNADASGLAMVAASPRRCLGQLVGGAEGEGSALLRAGDTAMEAQGIRNLDAMTAVLAPGCARGDA
jgi:hypothetical protein